MINLYPEKLASSRRFWRQWKFSFKVFIFLQIVFILVLAAYGYQAYQELALKKAWVHTQVESLEKDQASLELMIKEQARYLEIFSLAQKIYDHNQALIQGLINLRAFSLRSLKIKNCQVKVELLAPPGDPQKIFMNLGIKNLRLEAHHLLEGLIYELQGGIYACRP